MKNNIVSIDLDEIQNSFLYEESLSKLRTNIQFLDKNLRVLLFTSSIPGEGKTEVSFQLSVSLSKIGKKVVYIDGDMRNSKFAAQCSVKGKVNGISQFLSGEASEQEIIHTTNIENLDVVFSGAPVKNPSELLYDYALDKFIAEQKKIYDFVIIDSPSLSNISDAAIIGRCVDGAVIVIRSGKVGKTEVNRVKLQLEKVNCKILGIVLNRTEMKKYKQNRDRI